MFVDLDSYDWQEVFGEGNGGNCESLKPLKFYPTGSEEQIGFDREDVKAINGLDEGDNDGPDWIVWGVLKDDRWFVVRAGCDYTGWDCHASNSSNVEDTREDIIRYGMTRTERVRFGVQYADEY